MGQPWVKEWDKALEDSSEVEMVIMWGQGSEVC